MRLIVTEYGIIGGLVACGVIYVTSLMMDHYGL
jgi:Flp pilus assembly pilin Flp